ncbi:MAG: hypothetical protein QM642_05915 [Edaphocola sp.]
MNNQAMIEDVLPTESDAAFIRHLSIATEQAKCLPNETLKLIEERRWFQVLVPKQAGGLEWPLPKVVRLFEALAKADANVGWCVNLGAGANMFAGYLDGHTALNIFSKPSTCCAGSGAVSGTAQKTDGGYILTGHWQYASGASHATHFTCNAWILNEAGQRETQEGVPVFKSFIVPAHQVDNKKNWDAIGLQATSSNDFEIKDVFVPEKNCFTLLEPSAHAGGKLYRFPFSLMAVVNMTCMITGIAQHFSELYQELALAKKPLHADGLLAENPIAAGIFDVANREFMATRSNMYNALDAAWQMLELKAGIDEDLAINLKTACNAAANAARNSINKLFPLCGMDAIYPHTDLNKVWRDAAVAGQHYLLSPLQQ